jgi:hypothetical protein
MYLIKDLIKLYIEAVNKEGLIRKFNRRRSLTFRAPALVLIRQLQQENQHLRRLYESSIKIPCT